MARHNNQITWLFKSSILYLVDYFYIFSHIFHNCLLLTQYPWLRTKGTDSPATRTKKSKRRKSKNGLSREGSSKYDFWIFDHFTANRNISQILSFFFIGIKNPIYQAIDLEHMAFHGELQRE